MPDASTVLRDSLSRLTYDHRDRLPMWVVYDHPRDYPQHFVARMHLTLPSPQPTDHVIVASALSAIYDKLPLGLVKLARMEGDDPNILEVWL